MESFENVVQPAFEDVFRKDHPLKGRWKEQFFKNANPVVLELGCGKGEYTIGLATMYPEKNFLGVDIKGARMWKGAREATEKGIINAGFLRTRIELINSFFAPGEVSEIWITFPDPQIKKRRNKKRLTSARFLNNYSLFLEKGGTIHLKTDSRELFDYTNSLLQYNKITPGVSSHDLYSGEFVDDILSIRTHYEKIFLSENKTITYTRFSLPGTSDLKELPDDE